MRRRRAVSLAAVALILGGVTLCCRSPDLPPPLPPLSDGPLAGLRLEPASSARFERPIHVEPLPHHPHTLVVVEQAGRVWAVTDDARTLLLDLSPRVSREGNEEGLLGWAFAPDFPRDDRVWAYYSSNDGGPWLGGRSILSELHADATGHVDPDSETVLLEIEQPYRNHNGGALRFGPDGHLYLGLGDGGLWGDPDENSQDTSTLLGAILRLQVDPGRVSAPADNPFLDQPNARPELFAIGLRNPWRLCFDPLSGALWTGDVGQDAWEEVDRIVPGGNYGWPRREGRSVYDDDADVAPGELLPPAAVYPHSEGQSITGGVVYRGAAIPALWGRYLFADFVSGALWALPLDERGHATGDPVKLLHTGVPVASFGTDARGEVLLCGFDGAIHRLVPGPTTPPLPPTLSELQLFADLAAGTPTPRALPYDVHQPLWSDGADKERFVVLPPNTTIDPVLHDAWDLPTDTLVAKTFRLEGERLETRVIRRDPGGWSAASYRWRPDGADADRVDDAQTLPNGWEIPSTTDCRRCHTQAAGFVLGLRTRQLPAHVARDWHTRDALSALPDPEDPFPALESDAPLQARARAYLDVQCAPCHRPDGPGNAAFDLRAQVPLSAARLFAPTTDGTPALTPGDPTASALWLRARRRDAKQMPPLGTRLPHPAGLEVVRAWIADLPERTPR